MNHKKELLGGLWESSLAPVFQGHDPPWSLRLLGRARPLALSQWDFVETHWFVHCSCFDAKHLRRNLEPSTPGYFKPFKR